MAYATKTSVDRAGSVAELERIIDRYGASRFAYGRNDTAAWVMFELEGRAIRMTVPLPDPKDFKLTPTGRDRSAAAAKTEWEQACRSRWRAVVLIVKAKLEAIDAEISTIEREFLADLILPDGSLVGDHVIAGYLESTATRKVQMLLPEGV